MGENLNIYAVGDFGPRDRWNPHYTASSLGAWPVLKELAREPSTARALAERCSLPVGTVESMLSSLAELHVVKQSGTAYHLGFAWFTADDQHLVHRGVMQAAQELAHRLAARMDEIDQQLMQVKASAWTDIRDLRFALVGCFGLDWGGLDALKASGHLVHEKEQPGDRRYVLYVEEPVDQYNQKDYVGSHTTWASEAYRWTSFGDHSGRRFGLPDLIWHLRGAVTRSEQLPEEARTPLGDLVMEACHAQLDAAAEALIPLAKGHSVVEHPLLKAARAIEADRPAIPVFFWKEDGEPIGRVVAIVQETLLSVVSARYESLQAELADLTPLRHGVPFAECFNPIWHVWFGHTNRILAEQGILADPAPRTPGEGRYRWWLTVY